MKRPRQMIFRSVSVLSMALFAATCVAWIRSQNRCDFVYYRDERVLSNSVVRIIASFEGKLWLNDERYDGTFRQSFANSRVFTVGSRPQLPGYLSLDSSALNPSRNGFMWYSDSGDRILLIPFWAILLLSSVLPFIFTISFFKRQVTTAGHCRSCGYDLRATPDRCPECGTARSTELKV